MQEQQLQTPGQQLEAQQMQGQQLEAQETQGQQLEKQDQIQQLQTQHTQLQTQCHQYISQVNSAVGGDTGATGPSITPRTSEECFCYLDVMLHCCPDGDLGRH